MRVDLRLLGATGGDRQVGHALLERDAFLQGRRHLVELRLHDRVGESGAGDVAVPVDAVEVLRNLALRGSRGRRSSRVEERAQRLDQVTVSVDLKPVDANS